MGSMGGKRATLVGGVEKSNGYSSRHFRFFHFSSLFSYVTFPYFMEKFPAPQLAYVFVSPFHSQ
jgi:hypothetical protein